MINFFKILRIIIISFLFAISAFLIYFLFDKHLGLTGILTGSYKFKKKSPIVHELTPHARLEELGKDSFGSFKEMFIDPVYFEVETPSEYDYAEVCLTYKNTDVPVIYWGPQFKEGFHYKLKPAENIIIEKVIENKENFDIVQDKDLMLLQRKGITKKYSSVKEFLNKMPDKNKIGVFNFDIDYNYIMPEYKQQNGIEINTTLRGPHTMIVYVKNSSLKMEFVVQDMNRHAGEDIFEAVVLRNGNGVYSRKLKDDGYTKATDPATNKRTLTLNIPNLKEGAYVVDLHTTEDIFIRSIKTNQSYLVFKGTIYLADNIEYKDGISDLNYNPNFLYTNGENLSFRTTHKSGLQTIKINNNELKIDETHTMFYSSTTENIGKNKISIPENDIVFHSNGLVSFSEENFFYPYLKQLDQNFNYNDINEIDYIIANYESPEVVQNNIKRTCQQIFMNDFYVSENKLKFMISVPNLELSQKKLRLYSIDTIFVKQPIL